MLAARRPPASPATPPPPPRPRPSWPRRLAGRAGGPQPRPVWGGLILGRLRRFGFGGIAVVIPGAVGAFLGIGWRLDRGLRLRLRRRRRGRRLPKAGSSTPRPVPRSPPMLAARRPPGRRRRRLLLDLRRAASGSGCSGGLSLWSLIPNPRSLPVQAHPRQYIPAPRTSSAMWTNTHERLVVSALLDRRRVQWHGVPATDRTPYAVSRHQDAGSLRGPGTPSPGS